MFYLDIIFFEYYASQDLVISFSRYIFLFNILNSNIAARRVERRKKVRHFDATLLAFSIKYEYINEGTDRFLYDVASTNFPFHLLQRLKSLSMSKVIKFQRFFLNYLYFIYLFIYFSKKFFTMCSIKITDPL